MRQALTRTSDLLNAVDRVRQGSSAFLTNWFASPEQIQYWIDRESLSMSAMPGAVLLFRRDRDFHHLHHVATDQRALAAALASLDGAGVLTSDIVGRPEEVQAVARIYHDSGFREHECLIRMVRIADSAHDDYRDPEVVFAEPEDVDRVHGFLTGLLDPFRDQIPEPDDLRAAIDRRGVIIVRRGEALGGVLVFDTTGATSVLRYWYVNRQFRNQGIGARLIRTFFHLCRGSRRIILWVIADNVDAIAKYRHYGFTPEVLVDWIMINREVART